VSVAKLSLLTFLLFPFFLTQAATVVPQITKVSVTPTSAPAGTKFKFIATLNSPLNVGDKLKINVGGNSLVVMTGTGIQYSLSQAVFTAGKKAYTVGIYNNNGVLQGKVSNGTYMVTSVAPTNHAPTLTLIKAETSAIINTAYTVTLNAKDVDTNLSSITMNWGDSSEPETVNATDSKDLVFSHTYTSASSFGWNAFATDKGTPALNSKSVSKIVTISNPAPVEVIATPARTTGYTKIANNGSELPDSATLGANPTDWACTKDNKTGLIWEIKTNDGGLRDATKTYTNYTQSKNDVSGFTIIVNTMGLCGANNWRIPTITELVGIVYCSDGKYSPSYVYNPSIGIVQNLRMQYVCTSNQYGDTTTSPTINTNFFPDIATNNYWFWSSTSGNASGTMWGLSFEGSYHSYGYGYSTSGVRLVHDAK